jgi:glycosyltransferase involved in cell wall biosynthesis
MSKFCDFTVLYGLAGPHMGDVEDIETHLQKNGELPNVRFINIRPSYLARLLNWPNRNNFFVYSFYLAYKVWHRQAARKAQFLLDNEQFDLIHYLCPIGYREPGYLWQLDIPYVWGPVGGMVPVKILKGGRESFVSKCKIHLKNFTNSIQLRMSHRVARAFICTDKLIAATSENSEILKKQFKLDVQVIPENAIPNYLKMAKNKKVETKASSPVKLIWIGSLDARKSPRLLIDALIQISESDWHLDLVGDGKLRNKVRSMLIAAGLSDKITLHGFILRSEVQKLMTKADLHIVTSMSEGNPTVIWEAMSSGVPTLSLAHCGMRDTLCEACSVLIDISNYKETRNSIASKIDHLIHDPKLLASKKAGALSCAKHHLWSNRNKTWINIYYEVIENYKSNKFRSRS